MDDIVVAETYGTAFEAGVAVAHLESVGIRASVSTDNAGGAIPTLTQLSGGAQVLVRSEDVTAARRTLDDLPDVPDDNESPDAGDDPS